MTRVRRARTSRKRCSVENFPAEKALLAHLQSDLLRSHHDLRVALRMAGAEIRICPPSNCCGGSCGKRRRWRKLKRAAWINLAPNAFDAYQAARWRLRSVARCHWKRRRGIMGLRPIRTKEELRARGADGERVPHLRQLGAPSLGKGWKRGSVVWHSAPGGVKLWLRWANSLNCFKASR
jgi:hypothetical protein